MRDLRRKLLSLGNHFFERLKTANFSTACGTSTLKSLPSRAFFVSDVHLRPRKHFSRCTLDCGFKTSESPALRGFVGGPQALATAALYLAKIERPSPLEKPSCKVRFYAQNRFRKYRQKVTGTTLFQTAFHRIFQPLAQTAHVRLHRRKRVHTRLSEKDRTQRLTRRNTGRFGWGWYHYSRSVPHVLQHPRAGYQNGKLCPFWVSVGGAPKERRKPSEQRCAYACRCSEASRPRWAALLCLQLGDVAVLSLCAQYFLNVRGWGGTTMRTGGSMCRRITRISSKRITTALSLW